MQQPSFVPPRQVRIGDAARVVGTTPRAIRHYHQLGLLPERERGGDGRRRYGYDEIVRLLWIRKMADVGIALNDIRAAFADTAAADGASDVTGVLERLERTLAAQEEELHRQRTAVQRMRSRGSRMGLLDDFVSSRLEDLPEGSLREADLDTLLVMERIFGPLGAAVNASRYIALATHPELRRQSDSVDAAEEALDDTVSVDDPRVAEVARERHALESALQAVLDGPGMAEIDDAIFDSWDALHPEDAAGADGTRPGRPEAAARLVPLDWSPARVRCRELADEMMWGASAG